LPVSSYSLFALQAATLCFSLIAFDNVYTCSPLSSFCITSASFCYKSKARVFAATAVVWISNVCGSFVSGEVV
jgi:hypothetical protein